MRSISDLRSELDAIQAEIDDLTERLGQARRAGHVLLVDSLEQSVALTRARRDAAGRTAARHEAISWAERPRQRPAASGSLYVSEGTRGATTAPVHRAAG